MALTFELLRADDLLALRVETVNLKLNTTTPGKPLLVRVAAAQDAYLVYEFQPLSIIEKAYYEDVNGSAPLDGAGAVPARMAGSSRLVFRWPDTLKQVAFNLNALLDWSPFELVLSPTALGTMQPPPIQPPTDLQTALEIPYRLLLSPAGPVGWIHARAPVTSAGRTELWHSRVANVVKSGTHSKLVEASLKAPVSLRAIWSPDFVDHGVLPTDNDPGTVFPYLASLTPRNRAELVILTSGVSGYVVEQSGGGSATWVPQPVKASRLFLSALGGWLTSRGEWSLRPSYTSSGTLIGRFIDRRLVPALSASNARVASRTMLLANADARAVVTHAQAVVDPRALRPGRPGTPQAVLLSEWIHVATQGRDHYVKTVEEGLLYPFGHRAAQVTVTERKVVPPDGGVVAYPVAYLKQHKYIIVREKEKSYPASAYPFAAREMPFASNVKIHTLITPDIDLPPPGNHYWINVGGSGFPFHLSATDLAGANIDFLAQLIFVTDAETDLASVKTMYSGSGDLRLCPVHGKKVTYANPAAGDTTLRTTALFFDANLVPGALPPFPDLPFYPTLDSAQVTVPVLEELQGSSAAPTTVRAYAKYLSSDLDAHAGVYVQLDTPQAVAFGADKAGGFSTPSLSMTALSARKGVIAGQPDDAASGLIRPLDFFADLSAKLFGTVPLSALIAVDSSGLAQADPNAPEIRIQLKPNAKSPTTLITKLSWSPQITSHTNDPLQVTLDLPSGSTSALTLNTTLTRSLTGAPPLADIHGELTNFAVTLFGVVGIGFNSLKFSAKSGQKLIVKADLPSPSPIVFLGALAFLQTMADILPPGLFGGKGPSINILSDRIRVSYTLGLPPLTVGVFALDHIAITTGLDLPYLDGKPAFEFAFASRHSPFLILVECLGGGGFVHLVIDADGVQMVEGALEFGGEFSIDLGVASGGVHILAGIYFQLTDTSTTLSGFVDVGGEVSVLGIISISLDLNLSLTYTAYANGKSVITGRATLTVGIHILFFSMSVSISMEKSFGNTSGDPRIADVITLTDWQDYAAAFA